MKVPDTIDWAMNLTEFIGGPENDPESDDERNELLPDF